ncbi:hypothetical protein HW555_004446 [Spodoptera exigua]|uniref:Uncharacterized protein n=1 Tax=Spodoptera exigua TaxID=7107 RepID=A0A835L7K7_SPOEX|nr:hypothetical protein HW555_004446 [Spodoptera exigua]
MVQCGPHGRFEYCIDGIPGCVIGCHCHPGYYFDTDTKTCEPNVKLTQDIRQHYYGEHGPGSGAPSFIPSTETYPSATPNDRIGNKGNEILKDTDELGDWLYNQFFKTIESQVINNSNSTKPINNNKPPTRRSGGDSKPSVVSTKKIKTRRSFGRTRKRKHNMKMHGLRRKLLRITEDDSLRPKPPLPSFIFLPNMDTPYYPPIGLPPPPPMPMYPMVPVPPMGAPMYPFPGTVTNCDVNITTTTSEMTTLTTTVSTTTKITIPEKKSGVRRSKFERFKNRPVDDEEFMLRASEPGKQAKLKNTQRNKLMRKLRDKIKEKRKNIAPPTSEDESDLLVNLDDLPNVSDAFTSFKKRKINKEDDESQTPNLKDVDFKYLSELIHKVNQSAPRNKIYPSPPLPFDLKNGIKELQKLKAQPTRRNFDYFAQVPAPVGAEIASPYDQPRNLNKPSSDDAYYTNLGRQIASMIRNNEFKTDQPFNTDQHRQVPFRSVLNENNYSPGSLWERSVRSPLPQLSDIKPNTYLDESRTLKHSNEKNLLNLENEVESYVSTQPPLSLQELENILNAVEKAQDLMKDPLDSPKPTNSSLNVNILPEYLRGDHAFRKLYDMDNTDDFSPEEKTRHYFYMKKSPADTKYSNFSLNFPPEYHRGDNTYRSLFGSGIDDFLSPAEKAQYYFQVQKQDSPRYPKTSNINYTVTIPSDYVRGDNRQSFGTDNANILKPEKATNSFELQNTPEDEKPLNDRLNVHLLPRHPRGDIDNLYPIERAQFYNQLKNSLATPKPTNGSFHVLMVPKYTGDSHVYRRLYSADNQPLTHTPRPPNKFVEPKLITGNYHSLYPLKFEEARNPTNTSNKTIFQDIGRNHIPQSRDYWMSINDHVPNQLEREPKSPVKSEHIEQTNKPLQHDNKIQATNQVGQDPFVGVVVPTSLIHTNSPRTEYLQFLKIIPNLKQTSNQKREPMKQNNLLNYFSRNKYHYMFEKDSHPILAPFRRRISKNYDRPSYFHHNLHHYEYFD